MKFKGSQGEVVSSNGSQAGNDFVALYAQISMERDAREREWVSMLRGLGVKAAHPDDGWVDRKENTVHFSYPQFDDGVSVGDLVALGWEDKWRIVKVVEIIDSKFMDFRRYKFADNPTPYAPDLPTVGG